jgi:methylenetetrahydrofolate dehydrogenase (NADP+)/methenyltetrahydrofolate cyclohydrolase
MAADARKTVVVDGLALADEVRKELAEQVGAHRAAGRPAPCLAVVLVGDDPASKSYIQGKRRACARVGMDSQEHDLPAHASREQVLEVVSRCNADPGVDGILVQLPLPKGLDANEITGAVDPAKDVDGLTPISAGRLLLGLPSLLPCTPAGIMKILERYGIECAGARAVVIGRSNIVGKPIALLLQRANATVTMCHSRTRDLQQLCREADILVAAVGVPRLVRGDWVKPGAAVIDVGINRVPAPEKGEGKTKLVGDVHFASCAEVAGHITPVPGGVGLMTVACLLRNTVIAACARRGWKLPDGL